MEPTLRGLQGPAEEYDDYQPHSTATESQVDLIAILLKEIKASMTIGESIAQSIIDKI